ncbi:MAG TPA: hypothetical protein VF019_02915 [Nitrospira sp.]
MLRSLRLTILIGAVLFFANNLAYSEPGGTEFRLAIPTMTKLQLYLAAGDYRRALELLQRQIDDVPSAASYVHLTYVYQAIDAYLEHLSREERWTAVEQLHLNLAYRATEDLVDPPGGLARMAKEMIQTSVRQQSDVSAAMAARLDKAEADRLWTEQTQWRTANPVAWWRGIPASWKP